MSAHLPFLLEMGFAQSLAEKAITATGDSSLEAAMDWIIAHSEEHQEPEAEKSKPLADEEVLMESAENQTAKSIKCDECGKLFRSSEEVEFHAAKTNHSQFSESTEEKRPLSEEEKKEQLRKIEELMKQKRKEREEKEKAEQIEREKKRIQSGKELTEIKKRIEEQEIKKLAEERRREKEEEKRARQKVKEQIEQDKLARKMKAAGSTAQQLPVSPPTAQAATATPAAPKEYKETRIQIRLTNGSALTQSFGVKEQLAAVRLFIKMNRTDQTDGADFRLQTNFPKKVFTEEDYEKPLDVLGLVPSAVLILSKI